MQCDKLEEFWHTIVSLSHNLCRIIPFHIEEKLLLNEIIVSEQKQTLFINIYTYLALEKK